MTNATAEWSVEVCRDVEAPTPVVWNLLIPLISLTFGFNPFSKG